VKLGKPILPFPNSFPEPGHLSEPYVKWRAHRGGVDGLANPVLDRLKGGMATDPSTK